MSTYSVILGVGPQKLTGLAGSTPVVLWTEAVAASVQLTDPNRSPSGFSWATTPGTPLAGASAIFSFVRLVSPPGVVPVQTITLTPPILLGPLATLADAVAGVDVLIQSGNVWLVGTVVADTNTSPYPMTNRAAYGLVGYVVPTPGTRPPTYTLTSSSPAAEGEFWFSLYNNPAFYATTMSTVGGVPPGTLALVESPPGVWTAVQF